MVASSLAGVTYRFLAGRAKVRADHYNLDTEQPTQRNRDGAVRATNSKMSHSALLELVRVSWPENGIKASHRGVKRTVQNPRNFHIFLHSFTLAAYMANEFSAINIVESFS